jgi:hypothetical protein
MPERDLCPTQWYMNQTGVCSEKSSVPWPRSPAKIAGAILEREFGESSGIPAASHVGS